MSPTLPAPVGGRYRCLFVLGAGASSRVYAGEDLETGQSVAIKRIERQEVGLRGTGDLFRRELSVASAVRHPGLVKVYDAGTDSDDVFFIVMERLFGETLEARLARAPLTVPELFAVLDGALAPLAALHTRGIVHRDLKPSNVFLEVGGRVRILDLGIAKHEADGSVTRTGVAMGTPHYMAPEQALDARRVSPAADVWAVGVLMYRALAGYVPFEGEGPYDVVMRACTQPHPPLPPGHAPALVGLVDRCLAKDALDRPPDAAALVSELLALRARLAPAAFALVPPPRGDTERIETEDDQTLAVPARPPRSRWRWAAAIASMLIALGSGAWFLGEEGASSGAPADLVEPELAVPLRAASAPPVAPPPSLEMEAAEALPSIDAEPPPAAPPLRARPAARSVQADLPSAEPPRAVEAPDMVPVAELAEPSDTPPLDAVWEVSIEPMDTPPLDAVPEVSVEPEVVPPEPVERPEPPRVLAPAPPVLPVPPRERPAPEPEPFLTF